MFALNSLVGKSNIYISCFPKSGSSYLTALLQENFNLKPVSIIPGAGRREQEPTQFRMFMHSLNLRRGYIAQVHTKASKSVINMFKLHKLQPIILTRDIRDVIISLRDHLLSEGPNIPMAYVSNEFQNFSEERQIDFLIEFVVPWFFNFYASWYTVEKSKILSVKWITYEDYISNKTSTLDSIAKHYNLSIPKNGYEFDKLKRNTRKNKGVTGRGKASLSIAQNKKILSYTDYYKNVDFSLMGL
ncbi:hypothetical protein N9L92_01995 [Saprospiraceae bacterium]|nr:hypothetical protein [Saprospiraceae bacterium]